MKLSDTQRILLSKASQHPEGLVLPLAKLPAAACAAVARSMLKAGLVEVVRTSAYNAGDTWQVEGVARILQILPAGYQAIGLDAPAAAADSQPDDEDEDDRPRHERLGVDEALVCGQDYLDGPGEDAGSPAAPEGATGAQTEDLALLDQALAETPRAARTARGGAKLRDAATAVLAEWDALKLSTTHRDLDDAIAWLRQELSTLAKPARAQGAPRAPREGSKQEAVIAMLRRPEGASGPQMQEATGWAAHTVRGFLAGLKKKGMEVTVLEKVRKVGPNQGGAKGSYTVYRVV